MIKINAKLLTLAAALILFAACSSRAQVPPPEPEAIPIVTVLELPEPADYGQADPVEEYISLERGVIEDDVYISDFLGLSFTLPEGWDFADEETIAMMMGVGVELIAENGGVDLDTASIDALYDMVAYNATTDSNAMLMIERLDTNAQPLTSQGQLEALRERLEGIDVFGFEFGRPFTVWVAGEPFDTLPITVGTDEIQTRQYYLVRIHGGHMVTIIASLFGDITFAELLDHFG
ncbi:MAG: hypothetical protein FWE19_07985 [Oscillospiraceae bacterium]|nr:hypothetical protein [Oscillospiraceae bacterium]